LIAKKLGRYELVRVLGKGAMGVVYEARDPNLDRQVAIKTIMVDDLAPQAAAEYEERFRTEARSAARLQHPNIVSVYDSDRDGSTAFLVMEYIQGEDLKQHLDRGERPTPEQALALVADLLSALDFAHRTGVVHRDVKPANLLIEPGGRLKLTDFGVARVSGEATRTQGGMIGTLKYMAPEAVQGLKVDHRADLFSAAVVAYQLLTGVRPFEGDNDFAIIHQIIGQEAVAPTILRPELPPGVDDVLAKAMAKAREDRWQSAGEFSIALHNAFGISIGAGGLVTQPGTLPGLGTLPGATLPGATLPGVTLPGLLPSGAPRFGASATPTLPPGSMPAALSGEIELEYWRAVRDSADRHELEGFIARFPQGVYADLARRRLQRLAGIEDPDQTVLHAPPSDAAARGGAEERTQPMPRPGAEPAPDVAAAASPSVASGAKAPAPMGPAERPKAKDRSRAKTKAEGRAAAPAPAPSGRSLPVAAIAGAVLVAGGLAWLMLRGPSPAPQAGPAAGELAVPAATVAAPAAVATPPGSAAAPAPDPAPAAATVPTATATATSAAAAASAAARPVARAPAARPASRPVAAARPDTPAAAAPAPAAPVADAPALRPAPREERPATRPAVPSVEVACKDKSFFARPLCVHEQCARPELQGDPACVKLREEQRRREGQPSGAT
jgi:serine/threonine-protein kinase